MRRMFLAFVACLSAGFSFAAGRPSTGTVIQSPQSLVSESVYYTTTTCANSNTGNVVISTISSDIYALHISSVGSGTTSLYDARQATFTGTTGVENLHPSAIRLGVYSNLAVNQFVFNVETSSGLAMDVQGWTRPPCVTLIYRQNSHYNRAIP